MKKGDRGVLVLGLGIYFEEGRESLIWRRLSLIYMISFEKKVTEECKREEEDEKGERGEEKKEKKRC